MLYFFFAGAPLAAGAAAPALGRFAPYLERLCLRPLTPAVSSAPRTMWYLTPADPLHDHRALAR